MICVGIRFQYPLQYQMPFSQFNGKGIKIAIYTNEQAQSIKKQKQQKMSSECFSQK